MDTTSQNNYATMHSSILYTAAPFIQQYTLNNINLAIYITCQRKCIQQDHRLHNKILRFIGLKTKRVILQYMYNVFSGVWLKLTVGDVKIHANQNNVHCKKTKLTCQFAKCHKFHVINHNIYITGYLCNKLRPAAHTGYIRLPHLHGANTSSGKRESRPNHGHGIRPVWPW